MRKTILLLLIIFFSCEKKEEKRFQERWQYYLMLKDSTLNNKIFRMAQDTIQKWIDSNLMYWHFNKMIKYPVDYKLTYYLYFNSVKDKVFGYVVQRNLSSTSTADRMPVIIGEKYKGSWWFYPGPNYVIPREDEKKKIPSFEYLEYRARRIAMGWYYKEERKSFGDCNNFLLEFDFDGYNQCRKLNYTINDVAFESEFSTKSRTEEYDEPHERIEGYLQWISNPENKYIPEKK